MVFISNPKELEKLNNHETYQFVCRLCGKTVTKQFRLDRIKKHLALMCRRCGIIYTKQSKPESEKIKIRNKISTGHRKRTPEEKAAAVQQQKQTCKRIYGDPNYKNFEQGRKTYKLRTGYDNPFQNPEILAKIDKSFKRNHHGLSFKDYMKTDEAVCKRNVTISRRTQEDRKAISNKRNKTMRETGARERVNKLMSEIMKNKSDLEKEIANKKRESSNLSKYGHKNVCHVPEFREKILNYWKIVSEDKLSSRLAKSISTQMTKYNQYPYRNIFGKKVFSYYGVIFDSAWELAVWIYCIDYNIPIVRNYGAISYEFNDKLGEPKHYIPDFIIDGKLIEIKGDHFFKPDGTMYFPFNKEKVKNKATGKWEWVKLTPERKKYKDDLYERKRQCGLANGVEFWKESGCIPYIQYCETKFNNKYWYRMFLTNNPLNPSYLCGSIVNLGVFQPQIFFIPSNIGITPYDIKKEERYTMCNGKGLTPFDI